MTVEEFIWAFEGHTKEEEQRARDEWDRARWMCAILLSPHSKKGQRIQPTDLASFPWDEKSKPKADRAQNMMGAMMLKKWAKPAKK